MVQEQRLLMDCQSPVKACRWRLFKALHTAVWTLWSPQCAANSAEFGNKARCGSRRGSAMQNGSVYHHWLLSSKCSIRINAAHKMLICMLIGTRDSSFHGAVARRKKRGCLYRSLYGRRTMTSAKFFSVRYNVESDLGQCRALAFSRLFSFFGPSVAESERKKNEARSKVCLP